MFLTKFIACFVLTIILFQQQNCDSTQTLVPQQKDVQHLPVEQTGIQSPPVEPVLTASFTTPLGITFALNSKGKWSVSFTGVEIPVFIGTFRISAQVQEAANKKVLTIVLGNEKHVYDIGNKKYQISIPNDKNGHSMLLQENGNIYVIVPNPVLISSEVPSSDTPVNLPIFIDDEGQVFFASNTKVFPRFIDIYPIYLNLPDLPEKTLTVIVEDKKWVYDISGYTIKIVMLLEQGTLEEDKNGNVIVFAQKLSSRTHQELSTESDADSGNNR